MLLLFVLSSLSFSSVTPCLSQFLYMDSFSLIILLLTFFVLFTSFLFSLNLSSSGSLRLVFYSIFVPCFFVFSSSNMLVLYFFYEMSLVPILYIILKWGSYPERSLRAFMLLVYTRSFSLPLIGCLFYFFSSFMTFNFITIRFNPFNSCFLTLFAFLAFSVKLPIYGLHFWLPIAHVEAPTFGSMILAGVLLKLGGIGLIRFSCLIDLAFLQSTLLSYSLFFLVIRSLICCSQSDFKRLVAYSSVSHMMAIPILLISSRSLSFQSCVILITFHGLSSPILFSLVGCLYSLYSTRQLALMRGLLLFSPMMRFFCVVSFLFSLSAPPYPSFVSEVLFFLSSFPLSSFSLLFFLPFILVSLIYNLN